MNAWREILARVFASFAEHRDLMPEWLVNPDTNRRLKLDVVYPEVGIAIRFAGLQAGNRPRRPSLEEERQQNVRDTARANLCRDNGIVLVQIDVMAAEPAPVLQDIRVALSDASRRLAQSRRPQRDKAALIERLSEARSRLEDINRRVRHSPDLRVFADLWLDRQYAAAAPAAPADSRDKPLPAYQTGGSVHHTSFGAGYVTAIRHDSTGQLISVLFEDGVERTFAAHLVGDKMSPRV